MIHPEPRRRVRSARRRWAEWAAVSLLAVGLAAFAAAAAPGDGPAAKKPRPSETPKRAEPQKTVDFAHDIVPLIQAHCAKCHTNGSYKGSFSLDTREAMLESESVVPGKSAESDLIDRVTSDEPDYRMPQKGTMLTSAEVARLKAWIDQGAPWERGFTFKVSRYAAPLKLQRRPLPPPRGGRDHPIDRIVDAYFAQHKIERPQPLNDSAFVRRAFLDLIGLLPPPSEVEAFVASKAPDKHAKLARRLLGDRRAYADHWLTFWNDLLRNDYAGTGYIDGGRKQITDWLYQALLDDRPYDQFVHELISPGPGSEGFINGIKWRGKVNASQRREIQFSQNISQVFFGINIKCASCHDSFINQWKLADAYGLGAVIADGPLEMARCDVPTGKIAPPKFLWPELGAIDAKAPRAKRLEQLANLVVHPDNGRLPRTIANRLWQRFMGRGIVHPVDIMANEPWSEALLEELANFLVDHHYDLKALMEHIATSRTYQLVAALAVEGGNPDEFVFKGPLIKRMTAEQFVDAVWMITGAAPEKPNASAHPSGEATAPTHRFVRAALVKSNALLRSLGRPNREQVVTTRSDVLTTLEALDLSNGEEFNNTLAQGASKMLSDRPKATADEWIEGLYLEALSRKPSGPERAAAREVLGPTPTAERLADLLWVMLVLPEFQLAR